MPAALHWHLPLALEWEAFAYPHNTFLQLLPSYLEVHCDTVPESPDCRLSFLTAHKFFSIYHHWPPHWHHKASSHNAAGQDEWACVVTLHRVADNPMSHHTQSKQLLICHGLKLLKWYMGSKYCVFCISPCRNKLCIDFHAGWVL